MMNPIVMDARCPHFPPPLWGRGREGGTPRKLLLWAPPPPTPTHNVRASPMTRRASGLMVRDAPQAALLIMRLLDLAAESVLVLRSTPQACVSKDGYTETADLHSSPYAITLPGMGTGARRHSR